VEGAALWKSLRLSHRAWKTIGASPLRFSTPPTASITGHKGDISKELKKGTFLTSVDRGRGSLGVERGAERAAWRSSLRKEKEECPISNKEYPGPK
jgi:hypothetical protein